VIRSRPIALLTAALALALSVTACGGGYDDSGNAGPATTVGVASAGGLGEILVDSQGRTLYLFEKDAGTTSACSGDCAIDWPPVTTAGRPTVGDGLSASRVGTTTRSDGRTQITYNGHPLYLFRGDLVAGDAYGQGLNSFGAAWYVVSPAGSEITASGSSGPGYASQPDM
jgi:predicted lipoprotein with Yx(FWY)xxD motif